MFRVSKFIACPFKAMQAVWFNPSNFAKTTVE